MTPVAAIELVCPACRGPLAWSADAARCERDGVAYPIEDGITLLCDPAARGRIDTFLASYLAVRHAEGWTEDDAALLLGLPYSDASGRHTSMWAVRARGFEALRRRLARQFGNRRLRVVERGAGVGWLSYRLARDGHVVLATDVNVDRGDGLGAARHYAAAGVPVPCAAAEMDRLPIADASVDVVVNAASFHYAIGVDAQRAAIGEAARVLVPGGMMAIVDSPVYSSHEGGEAMLAEWQAGHPEAADSGYLVRDELVALIRDCGLEPSVDAHWMGWAWTANYLRHRLLGPREPAMLPLITGIRRR